MNTPINTLERNQMIPFFLFLQIIPENEYTIILVDTSEALKNTSDCLSYVWHDDVWSVKRTKAIVRFRSELSARVFAAGYDLDLADLFDQVPEDRQKNIVNKIIDRSEFYKSKFYGLGLSWINTQHSNHSGRPEMKNKEIRLSGKFK